MFPWRVDLGVKLFGVWSFGVAGFTSWGSGFGLGASGQERFCPIELASSPRKPASVA